MSVKVTQILTRISQADPPSTSDTAVGAGDTIVFTIVTDSPVYAPFHSILGASYNYERPTLALSNGGVATYAGVDAQGNVEFSYKVESNADSANLAVTGFGSAGLSLLPKDLYFDLPQVVGRAPYEEHSVIIDDFNNDGRQDILFGGFAGRITVYLKGGDGSFSKLSQQLSSGSPDLFQFRLKSADLNDDGFLDIVTLSERDDTLAVNFGRGDGTFSDIKIIFDKYSSYNGFDIADVDADGNMDLVGPGSIAYGDGNGNFLPFDNALPARKSGEIFISSPVGDINNDGILDFIYSDTSSVKTFIGSENRSFNLASTIQKQYPQAYGSAILCNLNGDGNPDLLISGTESNGRERFNASTIMFGNGDGTFRSASQAAIDAFNKIEPQYLIFSDIDGDGFDDIVSFDLDSRWNVGSYFSVDIRRGRGDGTFEDARSFPVGVDSSIIDLGDIDGDGKVDLVATSLNGNFSYVLNKSLAVPGTFDASSLGTAPGAQTGIRVDTRGPTVGGVTAGGPGIVDGTGTLVTGQTATITLTLTEAVTVTNAGSLVLSLNDGGQATFDAAASTATQLVFRHVVGLEQIASDLAVTGVALNGAVIRDAAGNGAVLSNAVTNPAGILRIDGDTGTAGDDAFKGRVGAQTYRGLAGDDTYQIDSSQDVVLEAVGEGRDTVTTHVTYALRAGQEIEVLRAQAYNGLNDIGLTGNAFAQTLIGNGGANTLDGGGGADVMTGEGGNDTYLIDDAGDQVVEAAGGGNDRVFATTSYRLAAGQEIEALQLLASTGKARLDLAGNEYGQRLVGNAGANLLDGGGGADTMIGGRGDDTYFVDAAGDQVVEAAGGGNDRVFATASYQLTVGQEVEALQLLTSTGKAKLDLIGNEFGQTLVGNAGANVLDGRGGADTMIGGRGDDKYVVDNAGDIVREAKGGGFDTVLTSVSHRLAAGVEIEAVRLLLSTGQLNLNLTGNEFGQALGGNAGANVLDGRGGSDILTGGRGQDAFQFSTRPGAGNVDRITDFAPVDDTIRLFEDVFSALDAGPLAARAFKNISTGKVDADDRILYEQATGALFYDADGSGRALAVKFAVLDNHAKLTHADFFVI